MTIPVEPRYIKDLLPYLQTEKPPVQKFGKFSYGYEMANIIDKIPKPPETAPSAQLTKFCDELRTWRTVKVYNSSQLSRSEKILHYLALPITAIFNKYIDVKEYSAIRPYLEPPPERKIESSEPKPAAEDFQGELAAAKKETARLRAELAAKRETLGSAEESVRQLREELSARGEALATISNRVQASRKGSGAQQAAGTDIDAAKFIENTLARNQKLEEENAKLKNETVSLSSDKRRLLEGYVDILHEKLKASSGWFSGPSFYETTEEPTLESTDIAFIKKTDGSVEIAISGKGKTTWDPLMQSIEDIMKIKMEYRTVYWVNLKGPSN